MASIILPDRWKRQPQGAVDVDWSNPLTNALKIAFLPSDRAKVGTPSSSSAIITPSQHGLAANITSRDTSYYYPHHSDYDGGNLSFFVLAKSRTITNNRNYFGKWADTADNDSWILRTESGVLKQYINVSAVWTNASAGTVSVGKVHALAGAYGYGGITAYLDGVPGTTASKSGNVASTSAARIGDAGLAIASPGDAADADIYLAMLWKRTLFAPEIKALSDNPWQVFKPRKQVIYSFGSSFPVLTSLGVSAITSSGGRLTAST